MSESWLQFKSDSASVLGIKEPALQGAFHFLEPGRLEDQIRAISAQHGGQFTGPMVSRLLVKRGLHLPRGAMVAEADKLGPHEWWLGALAAHLELPGTTPNNWLHRGWVKSRKLPAGRDRWIVWADDAEVERLRKLRSERRRWSDCRYPTNLTTPTPEQTRHTNRTGG